MVEQHRLIQPLADGGGEVPLDTNIYHAGLLQVNIRGMTIASEVRVIQVKQRPHLNPFCFPFTLYC